MYNRTTQPQLRNVVCKAFIDLISITKWEHINVKDYMEKIFPTTFNQQTLIGLNEYIKTEAGIYIAINGKDLTEETYNKETNINKINIISLRDSLTKTIIEFNDISLTIKIHAKPGVSTISQLETNLQPGFGKYAYLPPQSDLTGTINVNTMTNEKRTKTPLTFTSAPAVAIAPSRKRSIQEATFTETTQQAKKRKTPHQPINAANNPINFSTPVIPYLNSFNNVRITQTTSSMGGEFPAIQEMSPSTTIYRGNTVEMHHINSHLSEREEICHFFLAALLAAKKSHDGYETTLKRKVMQKYGKSLADFETYINADPIYLSITIAPRRRHFMEVQLIDYRTKTVIQFDGCLLTTAPGGATSNKKKKSCFSLDEHEKSGAPNHKDMSVLSAYENTSTVKQISTDEEWQTLTFNSDYTNDTSQVHNTVTGNGIASEIPNSNKQVLSQMQNSMKVVTASELLSTAWHNKISTYNNTDAKPSTTSEVQQPDETINSDAIIDFYDNYSTDMYFSDISFFSSSSIFPTETPLLDTNLTNTEISINDNNEVNLNTTASTNIAVPENYITFDNDFSGDFISCLYNEGAGTFSSANSTNTAVASSDIYGINDNLSEDLFESLNTIFNNPRS